jgi:hypothetical protein
MPKALRRSVASSIRQATEPGRILHHLLDGQPKMLISLWRGSTLVDNAEENNFEPERGDGSTLLVYEGSPLYNLRQLPAPEHTNLIQAVPLWFLSLPCGHDLADPSRVVVRGYGLVFPLFNTALLDYYNEGGTFGMRQYLYDPRLSQAEADRTVSKGDHFTRLQMMDAWLDSAQPTAPKWTPVAPPPPVVPWWKRVIGG